MYDSANTRRRINHINWAFALILAADVVTGLWLMLGGWPLHGWLRGFAGQSPVVIAVALALASGGLLFYHRPRPMPSWAFPDDGTVLYGLGLAAFCGIWIVVLALIHIIGG